ncbi:MAG: PAAR domain-containing protein [Prochloraceae cyanobacterium]|nr:PAAR domain-containing protein [Prochloraceae cyanobacterium]
MGKPAARLGDRVEHPAGYVLTGGPASPNVFIGGRRAWRAEIDIHICPVHAPGKVIVGSTKVFINGYPACRLGDKIVEPNAINTIVEGCPTVAIAD